LADRYSPLRQDDYEGAPRKLPSPDPELESFLEAVRLQAEDFSIPDLPDTAPASEPDAAYEPPSTLEEAKLALDAADKQLGARRLELDAFANETRGIIPLTHETSQEVIRRAKVIASARRDLAKNSEALAFSRTELEQAGTAAAEDPTFWQEALGVAGKTLGAVGTFIEHSPLAGIGETLAGVTSYGAERLGKLLGTEYARSGVNDGTFLEQLRDSPISPSTWLAATGVTPDSDVRKRGREFFKKAGASLGAFEKEVILTTPVLREYWKVKDWVVPVRPALEGMAILGKYLGSKDPNATLSTSGLTALEKDAVRDQYYELGLMLATDPLNLVDFGAPLTRLGSLRKVAKANSGTLEVAALAKTLAEVPEIGARLGPEAFKTVEAGELINELRKAGVAGDEAEALAKRFDQARKANFKDLRDLASADPQAWGQTVRGYLESAPGKGTTYRAEQLKALDRIGEFGDEIDPILGRTAREQAELGQSAKVWKSMYEKFGDRAWFKAATRPWALLTGQALLHDIGGNKEMLDLYFANRLFKADAGAEIMRYQQDVNGKARDLLNGLNKKEQAELFEALPRVVEHVSPEARKLMREGIDANAPLKSALIDMADLYDESAETLKAIQNRFGLKVADLGADLGYFGRQFSDELQSWLLHNPSAREFLYGEKIKRSRAALGTAFLPEERARKLKDLDFAESETFLREKFREYGLPDNVKVWSRDAFGNLAERAKKTLHTAEKRNLWANFAEAHAAQVDGGAASAAADDILDLIHARQVKANMKGFTPVEEAVGKSQKAGAAAQDAKVAADRAKAAAGEQEAFAAQVKAEMGAAEKRYREKVADFQAKGGEYAKAAADYKKAKSDYFDSQAKKGAAAAAKDAKAESAADASMRDATQRQLKAHEALKKAKGTGTATPAELNQLQKDVAEADEALKAAKAKGEGVLPKAQEARAAADKLAAESSKAEARFKQAQAELEAARTAMMKNHPDFWTPEQKAKWLLGNMKAKGKLAEYGPNGQQVSALEVLLKSKITPPSDWEELARYVATNLTPRDAEEFTKLTDGLYWRDMQTPGWVGRAYDSLKAIYQRSTLARIPSLMKDLFGTSINGLMAGNVAYWDRAMKEVGTFRQWRDPGFRKGSTANKLSGVGVLKTTKGEALEQVGALEEILPGFVGKAAGRVEKHGVIGAAVGKEVGGVFGAVNEARQYWEELNRVATFLKATDEGADFTSAVNDVYKWWGKFDEVSKLERNVFNRVLFFWSWMARSVPVSIAHLFEHPVRSKLALTMMAGNADDDSKTPNWLRRMGAWVLGTGEDGTVRSINLGGSTYFSPTFSMLQGNFANQMMHGKPLEATSGALKDLVRATPPYVQAFGELAMQSDFFTEKDWWKNKNSETGSNAKAPAALWWVYTEPGMKGGLSALSDLLGLKPVIDRKTGDATHLTMNPAWAWFFGSLPGLDPLMTDVSAFFTPPKKEGVINAKPEFDLKRGLSRQAGFPVYDVPVDDAKRQIYDFRKALSKSADGLSGSALYVDDFGRVAPSNRTWRGQKMRADLDSWEAQARGQGMTAKQAKAAAMDKAKLTYGSEWRILTLQDRLEAWEEYLVRLEEGGDEVSKAVKADIEQLARRADYSRTQRYQDKVDEALLPKEFRR
jgi:hypothetical protein